MVTSNVITGIYWIGPVFDIGGYGNVSRNYVKAIHSAGIPVKIHSHGGYDVEIGQDTIDYLNSISTNDLGDNVALIIHYTPDGFTFNTTEYNVVRRIGITIFETDRIPSYWVGLCNMMDEVWIPSQFNYNTFSRSGVSKDKLKIVPYAIDHSIYYKSCDYNKIVLDGIDNCFKFIYTSTFDYRKGYDLLVKAFSAEFSEDENVALVLKVHSAPESAIEEIRSYSNHSKIKIITERYNKDMLVNLYKTCDVYVSTDRANGWGMPCMEMMAIGKPAMTINWSGSTEFMNDTNAFLIPPEDSLEPVDQNLQQARGQLYGGHCWARVTVESVRKTLREAYENKAKREIIAINAEKDMRDKYSFEAVGKIIREILPLTL